MNEALPRSIRTEKVPHTSPASGDHGAVPWLALVAEKVAAMAFGVVQITVHESKVVQIEHTERHRLDLARRH